MGVSISDEPEKVLSHEADIVIVGVAGTLPRMFPIYKKCLEAKINVATIGESSSYSWRLHPELTAELDSCAKANGVTITGTGAQDFGIVHLGVLLSGACHKIKKIIYRSYFDATEFGKDVFKAISKIDLEKESPIGELKGLVTNDSKALVINDEFLVMQKLDKGSWQLAVLMKNSSHMMFCTLIDNKNI